MGKVLFTVVALVASLVCVESLVCNKCSFGLVGVCINKGNETCGVNVTQCFTQALTFPSLSFSGLSWQGCATNTTACGEVNNTNIRITSYRLNTTCCEGDLCNTIFLNGAPSTKMTFTTAIVGAILASVWGGIF